MASLSMCSRALVVSQPRSIEAIINRSKSAISRIWTNSPMLLDAGRLNCRFEVEELASDRNTRGSIFSLLDRLIPNYYSSTIPSRSMSCRGFPLWSNHIVGSSSVFVGGIISDSMFSGDGTYYSPSLESHESDLEATDDLSNFIWLSSTLKKRRTKMNKHKLKKRRKKLRLQSKK